MLRRFGFAVGLIALALASHDRVLSQDAGPAPRFEDGDLATLAVKVVRMRPVERGGSVGVVEVEVTNRSRWNAEPLVFLFAQSKRADAETRSVSRVPLPHHGRAGRAVAPGRKLRYWLRGPFPIGDAKPVVRVTTASFFDGDGVSAPPVVVKGRRKVKVAGSLATLENTIVRVRNEASFPVDAIFRVKVSSPIRGESLASVALEAREEKEWTIEEVAIAGYEGAGVDSLELIDWSARLDDGAARARSLLVEAWSRWQGAENRAAISGRFMSRMSSQAGGGVVQETTGRFTVPVEGDVVIRFDDATASGRLASHRGALVGAFYGLMRPTAERLARDWTFRLATHDTVELAGPPWDPNQFMTGYVVADGAIVGRLDPNHPDAFDERWHRAPLDDGWVLGGMDFFQKALGSTPSTSRRWRHERIGGRMLPVWYREVANVGDAWYGTTELELAELTSGEAVVAAAPSGAAAPDLAAVWDSVYRYPDETVELTGEFAVKHSGDGVWQGVRDVRGRFRLAGFRGMLMGPGRWDHATFEIEGKLAPRMKEDLAAAVEDRFRMWAFRDFAGRGPFAEELAGAVVVRGADDAFVLSSAPLAKIVVRDGLPEELTFGSGSFRTIRYDVVAGVRVPARITTGSETLEARFREVADGWVLPVDMHFSRVFGDDWDERLTLSHLKLVRP